MPTVCSACGRSYEPSEGDTRGVCPHCGAQVGAAPPTVDIPPPGGTKGGTEELPLPDDPSAAFGETPRVGPPARPTGTPLFPESPRYKPLGELGRGGMGIVYKAHDSKLNRVVALKVLIAGEGASEEKVRRFFQEATSAARLRHPNIIPIHELDVKEGRHYFTMDFVEGGPLSKLIAERKLTPRRAVEILEQVARAVHHAHEHGIIHRDLKPSNIIVTPDGRPMVMDFGLAKEVESDKKLTQTGVAMGTPEYMAPEQARGDTRAADARTDVWALGAVLYEMVTGLPPFVGATGYEIVSKVVYDDPIPPRSLSRSCPRDVETIVLKCLEKDPGRRYQTAQELAEDCRRFLGDEAIAARPASVIYRARKRIARHRAVATVTAIAVVALVGLAVWSYVSILRERNAAVRQELLAREAKRQAEAAAASERDARAHEANQRRLAELREIDARENLQRAQREIYGNRIALASAAWHEKDIAKMSRLLADCASPLRGWEWGWLRSLTHPELFRLEGHQSHVNAVAYSPDGTRIASGGGDSNIRLWDSTTGRLIASLTGHHGTVTCVAFAPAGRILASCAEDGVVKLWELDGARELKSLIDNREPVSCVAFDRTGERLASVGEEGVALIWDVATGSVVQRLSGHEKRVTSVAFSPGGEYVVSGSLDGTVAVWDSGTGERIKTIAAHGNGVESVAWSRDGRRIVSGGRDFMARIWDAQTGAETATFKGHARFVRSVCFEPDGTRVASGGDDSVVYLWDASTCQEVKVHRGHVWCTWCVTFSPDGRRIASANDDHSVRIWSACEDDDAAAIGPCDGRVTSVAFSRDGTYLAASGDAGTFITWDVRGEKEALRIAGHDARLSRVVFSPDGNVIATASWDGSIALWDVRSGRELRRLPKEDGHRVTSIAWSPAGHRLASISWEGMLRIWDTATGTELERSNVAAAKGSCVAYGPDGRLLAICADSQIEVRDSETGRVLRVLCGHRGLVAGISFSPDGRLLASAGHDKTVAVWDIAAGQSTLRLGGHAFYVADVCFSPDGRRLASASLDRTVRIWDTQTGSELVSVKTGEAMCTAVAFSPEGSTLAVGLWGGSVRLFDADPWWEPGHEPKRPEPVRIEIKPVPEARPDGAGKADEQF